MSEVRGEPDIPGRMSEAGATPDMPVGRSGREVLATRRQKGTDNLCTQSVLGYRNPSKN